VNGLALNRKLVYAVVAIAVVLLLTGALLNFYPKQSVQAKAAIIDQLSSYWLSPTSRHPNQTFIDAARAFLSTRFVSVDYYWNNATVDGYRNLASLGYKLILWRVHTALDVESKYVAISTSERNDSADFLQYSNGELTLCKIADDSVMYFAITPKFVAEVMNGRFEDTVIILMSCNGLKKDYEKTAEAFIEKGAKMFISWDEWIEPADNDNATALLLQYLINENNTVSEAVGRLSAVTSVWGISRMDYYPKNNPEVAGYRIPNYRQNVMAGGMQVTMVVFFEDEPWRSTRMSLSTV
jgi:hypothetical protein